MLGNHLCWHDEAEDSNGKSYMELFDIKNVYVLLVCSFVSGDSEEQLALQGFLWLSPGQLEAFGVVSCASEYDTKTH